jgi:hypothetical protein
VTPLPALTGLAAAACLAFSSALIAAAPATTTATGEAMTVSPALVTDPGDGPGGCSAQIGGQFYCHVTIHNRGTASLSWQSYALDSGQGNLQTTIKPNHGTLAPGTSVHVTISTPDCGFSLADLANFLGLSGFNESGGAVLFSCG